MWSPAHPDCDVGIDGGVITAIATDIIEPDRTVNEIRAGADLVQVDDASSVYSQVALEVAADLGRPLIQRGPSGRNTDPRAIVDTAIRDGNPWDTALARATSEPARMIGLEDQVGLIAHGMLAEFVIIPSPGEKKGALFDTPPLAVIHAAPAAAWRD